MIARQGGLCAICSKPFSDARTTHVDHDHITDVIRGILCNSCNTKLGWYEAYTESITNYMVGYETKTEASAGK